MALAFNTDHTVYYHMDALWSMGLAWTYFTHPAYVFIQCRVCTTYLSPDNINQMEPQTYHYVK